jgi:hypothetical protein
MGYLGYAAGSQRKNYWAILWEMSIPEPILAIAVFYGCRAGD